MLLLLVWVLLLLLVLVLLVLLLLLLGVEVFVLWVGEAVALVAVDDPVTPDVVAKLCALEGVREVVPLSF